jgi:hypothetical protein
MRQAEDDSGGWGISRLWRRDNDNRAAVTDDNGSSVGGFGSLVASNSVATSPSLTRSRAVFLPSAPNELKIGIHRCVLSNSLWPLEVSY